MALLQQVGHDPLELPAERPLVALGQAFQLQDQMGRVERRGASGAEQLDLALDPLREVLVIERRHGPKSVSRLRAPCTTRTTSIPPRVAR
jgi:hypothetical protein